MAKQSIKTINDKAYVINAFMGEEGWSYIPRLTKYIFPFIGFAFNAEVKDEEVINQMMDLMSGENAKEVQVLVKELVKGVQVDGSAVDFNKEFSQNYDALLLLVMEVIKLNYFDSFQRLVTNLKAE